MNRQTRKMLLNVATGVAVAATAAVVFIPAANAAPGTVTANVNVRSGPGTNYSVLGTATRGQQVDVQQCQGSWCYVVKSGADGWVSSRYLTAAGGQTVNPTNPGISFGFSVGGPNGPQINIGVGNQAPQPPVQPQPPRPPVEPPVQPQAEACFYDGTSYRGPVFCAQPGQSYANLGSWADRISSIDNQDGLRVQVCSEPNFVNCRTYTTSATSLGDFNDYVVSLRIR
jgi:uncharacterized protein YraI